MLDSESEFNTTYDSVTDAGANDAVIRFEELSGEITADFWDGSVIHNNASWTADAILRVDAALDVLHRTANSPVFLRHEGSDIRFRLAGERSGGDAPGDYAGWNRGDGQIVIVEFYLQNPVGAMDLVFHEIGHNWDTPEENGFVPGFRDISGWAPNLGTQPPLGYVVSRDGDWWYLEDSSFVSEYATTNPKEDFAEHFGVFWMLESGVADEFYQPLASQAPFKIAYMGAFVDDMS